MKAPCVLGGVGRVVLLALALACVESPSAATDSIQSRVVRADALYAARSESVDADRRAAPGPIAAAIDEYESLLRARPTDLGIRWRLLRALYFAGDHSSEPPERRRGRLERARDVGADGMDQIANAFSDGTRLEEFAPEEMRLRIPEERREEVAAVYYWTAVAWGAWSQLTGTWSAISDGVVNRIHEFSGVVIALRPGYERGGAHRLRAYLHATVPSLPLVSGWIDEDEAVPESKKALGFDADDRGNRLIHAIALLETREDARDEAVEILQDIALLDPRDESRTEDLSIRALALEKARENPDSP